MISNPLPPAQRLRDNTCDGYANLSLLIRSSCNSNC